jgi:hypothetical protein
MNFPICTILRKNGKDVAIAHWEPSTKDGRCLAAKFYYIDDERNSHEHSLEAGITTPSGAKWFIFDDVGHGAWAHLNVPGFELTESDLYWATAWALEAAKHKHAVLKGLQHA